MGMSVARGSVVGEHIDGTKHWVACPRCGEYNEGGAPRCRDCLTSFLEMPVHTRDAMPRRTRSTMPARTRATTPKYRTTKVNLDALWTELEALTRSEEAVWFQCPICSSLVDRAATHCVCGAIFEEPGVRISYACPLCNAKVASDAVRCRCGARFSD